LQADQGFGDADQLRLTLAQGFLRIRIGAEPDNGAVLDAIAPRERFGDFLVGTPRDHFAPHLHIVA